MHVKLYVNLASKKASLKRLELKENVMKHEFIQKVFYSDTDAYGVVWHGAYLRWLEMGRVIFCEKCGYKLSQLAEKDIVLPVVELNVKYKASAKLDDELKIVTEVVESKAFSLTFKQIIQDVASNKVCIEALVKVVAVNNEGKLYRKLPETMIDILQKAGVCQQHV